MEHGSDRSDAPTAGERSFKGRWQRVFGRSVPNLALRVVVMFAGLVCIALGIAMAKMAGMGTSPISSMPAVLTAACEQGGVPMTMGAWTFVFNAAFFVLEIALLRRAFKPIHFLQIPLFFVLAVSVDAWLGLLSGIELHSYAEEAAFLALSILALGVGIRVQLEADLLMTPGDAAVQVVSYVARRPFNRCKVAWDVSLMVLAALTSFLLLGGLYQVREGTIIAALLVGPAVRLCDRAMRPASWLVPKGARQIIPPLCPDTTDEAAQAARLAVDTMEA